MLLLVALIFAATQVYAAGDLIVDGKLGVGTTTPSTSLDIQGDKLFRLGTLYANSNSSSYNNYQRFSLGYGIYWDAINNNYKVTDRTYNQATFSNENGKLVWTSHSGALASPQTYDDWHAYDRMVLTNQGNVGIGTTVPTSKLQVVGLPAYANNAAAKAGGLTAGAFYRTGGDPDLVCVVH